MQSGLAAILIVVGFLGLFLPHDCKWNPLGLRRGPHFTDGMYRKSPKVLGSIILSAGLIVAAATALGYRVA
jgi:hypothetical protein